MRTPTLWKSNIATEHGPNEIVDLPIESGGSFHRYVNLQEGISNQWDPGIPIPSGNLWKLTICLGKL